MAARASFLSASPRTFGLMRREEDQPMIEAMNMAGTICADAATALAATGEGATATGEGATATGEGGGDISPCVDEMLLRLRKGRVSSRKRHLGCFECCEL
eukprot:5493338-Pleurochrysis_carterae.AAC.1